MIDSNQFLKSAIEHYRKGNFPQAEAMCRYLVANDRELPDAYNLLGMVSLSTGLPEHAVRYFKKALRKNPSHKLAKKNLKLAKKNAIKPKFIKKQKDKFLLIKAWGSGFWADMDHVLGQLLLAEMTNRIPIVHWGENSLYHNEICENAFELYFEQVSNISHGHLTTGGLSYFPPKWNKYNLNVPELNKSNGHNSRMAGLYYLSRNEDVAISDFHTYVSDLLPWIAPCNPLSNMNAQEIYRYLFKKYIRLKPEIGEKINHYWSNHIKGNQVLAIHVRGSDKIIESQDLNAVNARYHNYIEKFISNQPAMFIFLLTDSTAILDEFKQKYGDKLIYRDCTRTENTTGIHYLKGIDRKLVGIEIIMDTYIASMCDAFIGYGGTNVSTSILHLKKWDENKVTLLGNNALFQPHLFLHNR